MAKLPWATNLVTLSGSIPIMLEGALDWARKTFNTSVVTTPHGEVTDQSQYPLDAFRELIGNALAHRDLYCLVSGPSSRGETSAGPARHH